MVLSMDRGHTPVLCACWAGCSLRAAHVTPRASFPWEITLLLPFIQCQDPQSATEGTWGCWMFGWGWLSGAGEGWSYKKGSGMRCKGCCPLLPKPQLGAISMGMGREEPRMLL